MTQLNMIHFDQVEVTDVEWLWYPFIPYGKLTLIHGDPGEGKTTLVLQLASLLSKGEPLPFDEEEREPISVIYQTSEDGYNDTIVPRVLAAKGDCSKFIYIDESLTPLSMIDERLELAIIETGAKLVILDPVQAYLGSSIDMNRANEVRPMLTKLKDIAERHQCAIILIGHLNKNSSGKSNYRSLGSIDIPAAARSVLVVARIKDQPEVRVVAQAKNSLAPEGESFAFKLSKDNGFMWDGKYDITVDDLLNGACKESQKSRASRFLLETLENGAMASSIIYEKATAMGLSKRTVDQCKKEHNIKSKKEGTSWYWFL